MRNQVLTIKTCAVRDIMEEIRKIRTMRRCLRGQRLFFQIVYEWEDILSKNMGMKLSYLSDIDFIADRVVGKIFHMPFRSAKNNNRRKKALFFEMSTTKYDGFLNRKNVICCVIDYFVPREDISAFEKNHDKADMVLISSREVYEYLIQSNCSLNLAHFPLSISDKWMFDKEKYEKQYDVILTGRANSVLLDWLIQYMKRHTGLKVLAAGEDIKKRMCCQLGDECGDQITVKEANSREQYMHNLRISRVMFYATPGMDEGEKRTNGWNQVTPRFLEGIAAQCHMICRFEDNADTEYYQLRSFSVPCICYEEFDRQMKRFLSEEVDLDQYRNYLQDHLTSKRVELLQEITRTKENNTRR